MKSKPPSKRCRTDQSHGNHSNGSSQGPSHSQTHGQGNEGGRVKEKDKDRKVETTGHLGHLGPTIEEIKSSMASSASEIFSAKKYIISSATMTASAVTSPKTTTASSEIASSAPPSLPLTLPSSSSVSSPETRDISNSSYANFSKLSSNSLLNSILPFPHFTLLDISNGKDFPRLSHFGYTCESQTQNCLSPTQNQNQGIQIQILQGNSSPTSVPVPVASGSSWTSPTVFECGSPGTSPVKDKDPMDAGGSPLNYGNVFTMEDVDGIQLELESLWSHISVRIRSLEKEHLNLFGIPRLFSSSPSSKSAQGGDQSPNTSSSPNSSFLSSGGGHPVHVHSHGTRTNTCNSPNKLLVLSSSVCATAASPVRLNKSPSPSTAMNRKGSAASTITSASLSASSGSATSSSLTSTLGRNGAGSGNISTLLPTSSLKLAKLPKKKLKGDTAATKSQRSTKPAARAGQNRSHSMAQDGGASSAYRQAAPNQFWDFADSYCREMTYSDFYALERTMEEHESLPESLFDIPPLGPHFKNNGPASPNTRFRDRIETRSKDTYGPLTQRLVSALVDRSIANYLEHRNGGASNNSNSRSQSKSSKDGETVGNSGLHCHGPLLDRAGLLNALGLTCDPSSVNPNNSQPLEARIRQVLLDQGFLSREEIDADGALLNDDSVVPGANSMLLDDSRDEILMDIKHTQQQLRHLHEYNSEKLKQLHLVAKRELDRISEKCELEKADKELMEAYRVVSSSRAKKKPLSKREREVATRALENRQTALAKLYQVNSSSSANANPTVGDQGPGISRSRTGTTLATVTTTSSMSVSHALASSSFVSASTATFSTLTCSSSAKEKDRNKNRSGSGPSNPAHSNEDENKDENDSDNDPINNAEEEGQDREEVQQEQDGGLSDDGSSSGSSGTGSTTSTNSSISGFTTEYSTETSETEQNPDADEAKTKKSRQSDSPISAAAAAAIS